ncbi:28 kDa heat- and acid-stable phosphoprotein-like [Drosophila teissieri]|uniref:28 kDa heat- and acid-stable phosphoprotein-like n=1 Tax=Drosophila teissieri TaxID=7243 RepID=UPI001CBA0782|nr:28 kDa heat- and acid-stable phosphoprotein-like [Drosophila teissieri]
MPRGKFVNYKGRTRQFTSPEELQQDSEDDSDQVSGSGSDGEDQEAAVVGGASSSSSIAKNRHLQKATRNQKITSAADAEGASSSEEREAESRDAKKGVASLIEIENPNRVAKKGPQKVPTIVLDQSKPGLSRRGRDSAKDQSARQRYEKLHTAGKTTEARADLARLALIRQQREETAARRAAEKKAADMVTKKPFAK